MGMDKVIFSGSCHCKYKAFLKSSEVVGEPAEYELVQLEADDKYRVEAIERLLRLTEGKIARHPISLPLVVEGGTALVLGAKVEALGMALTCEVIEVHVDRHENRERLPVPVLFSHKNKLDREDSLLAALHGIVLAEAIDLPVPFVKVVHGSGFSVSKIKLDSLSGPTRLATETRQILDRLRRQAESSSPPLMILNSHCPSCEFRDRCHAEAINKDDLSLLPGMSEKEILAQRKRGITTVTQFAHTFRPKSIGLRRSKPLKRHLHALQALAVRDKKVYVVRAPEIPAKTTRVYLDVEGLPDRDFYYLVGVLVERNGECSAQSYWADNETEERAIWVKLVDLLRALGDCTICHYGSYEKAYIKKLLRKYPSLDTPLSEAWNSALFNVLGAIRTNVYFPAYSNGLKDIGAFLGATWTKGISSGIECIGRRLRWEESRDSSIKEEIIEYNQRDRVAVQRVAQFLASLGSPEGTVIPHVQLASEIAVDSHGRFGKVEFAVPEMGFINKCARFDYQRDKVLVRTDPAVRASARRNRARGRTVQKPNVEIQCRQPPRCPFCGHSELALYSNQLISKLVYDLKITRNGVKRWVVKYVTKRYRCRRCDRSFHSEDYPTKQPKIGHSLSSWAVYQHVALRQSFADISLSTNDLFGYSHCRMFGEIAQTRFAEVYMVTVDKMLNRLRFGLLIHADETKVQIKHSMHGYVWAFTGTEIVVYLYHPTRDGTFLKQTLGDFAGVLVSDFYAAYDSITCHQQKCHLHLMRDINDDLLQHPFDEELKELGRKYTLTLKPMVETIDKHGLKTKFLSKHKQNTEGFLDWNAKREVTSEIAQGYKSRIEKYGVRLFTFLDYDGIPWNNNNAENALKLVASRRKLFGSSVSEAGLKDYLVFLSIYQTLRRKGISLLRFLLSGETDLEKFVVSYRRS
jgi:predicted RecB family nuclease